MNEPKFENRYTRDEALFGEYYRYYCFRIPRRIVYFIIVSLAFFLETVCLVLSILFPHVLGDKMIQFALFMAACLFFLVLPFFRYRKAVKMALLRDREANNGAPMEICVRLTEDALTVKSANGSEITVAMAEIQKIKESRRLIWLISKTKVSYLMKRDGFTVGDAESFLLFAQEKIEKKSR